jgi:hypothetical protein
VFVHLNEVLGARNVKVMGTFGSVLSSERLREHYFFHFQVLLRCMWTTRRRC